MAVVCAGPKAILDVPSTIEYLETRGVPVVAIGQAELPGFYARSAGILAPPSACRDEAAAAALVATHLALGLGSGILRVRAGARRRRRSRKPSRAPPWTRRSRTPTPRASTVPTLTPWLLARIAVITDGRRSARTPR